MNIQVFVDVACGAASGPSTITQVVTLQQLEPGYHTVRHFVRTKAGAAPYTDYTLLGYELFWVEPGERRYFVGPDAPNALDELYVDAFFARGARIDTHTVTVTGNHIEVHLIQDGPDPSPNPPVSYHEVLGRFPAGTYTVTLRVDYSDGSHSVDSETKVVAAAEPRAVVRVVEFYNQALDHYFLSSNTDEIGELDGGVHPGWARTGESFNALKSATVDTAPVCRAYILPVFGDSHFFSAFGNECANSRLNNYVDAVAGSASRYVPETSQAFYVSLPDIATGACPASTVPVYRLWNQRADSNHRYTTSLAIQAQMVGRGYIREGYGPQAVAMCAMTQ